MRKNFKGENFCEIGIKLIKELDIIANKLKVQMESDKTSFNVSKIINTKHFNDLWNDEPNNPDGNKHSKKEYKGVYGFAKRVNGKMEFQYIGISQTIRRRFKKHVLTNSKNSASWAYAMAKYKYNLEDDLNKAEKNIPIIQKKYIYPCKYTFVQIDDHMLMHIAEVYCVNKLKAKWNTFETH